MSVYCDQTKCASVGICESVAPEVFQIGPDGALHIDLQAANKHSTDVLEEAVESCPTGSLTLQK